MTAAMHNGVSKSRDERDKKTLVGELFRKGKRDVALALIRNEISVEDAQKHLR